MKDDLAVRGWQQLRLDQSALGRQVAQLDRHAFAGDLDIAVSRTFDRRERRFWVMLLSSMGRMVAAAGKALV